MHAEGRSGRGGRGDRAGVVAGQGGLGGDGGGLAGGRGAGLGAGGLDGLLAVRTREVGRGVDPPVELEVSLPVVHGQNFQNRLRCREGSIVGSGHEHSRRGIVGFGLRLDFRLRLHLLDGALGGACDVCVRLVFQLLRDVRTDLILDPLLRVREDLRLRRQIGGTSGQIRHVRVEVTEDVFTRDSVELVAVAGQVGEAGLGGGGGADGGVAGHRSLLSGHGSHGGTKRPPPCQFLQVPTRQVQEKSGGHLLVFLLSRNLIRIASKNRR